MPGTGESSRKEGSPAAKGTSGLGVSPALNEEEDLLCVETRDQGPKDQVST